jgi:hypothetical protein
MPARGADAEPSRVLRNGAHLLALSAFALAQPLFDILGQNPEFFAVRASTATEIVLFALAVTFAAPLLLLGVEVVVGLVSRRARDVLHLVIVGALGAIIALHVLAKNDWLSGGAAIAACLAAGAAGALLYRRAGVVRAFLSILALAPIAFLALFLVSSPVSKLVFTEPAAAETVAIKARTPVVLVVFDEFSSASLMSPSGRVDARRAPNFAAFARDSIWFRNATTVHAHTNHAVPAILDGKLPEPGNLPILADHPRNLFTLLGGSYDLRVVETETHMCPPRLCRGGGSKARQFDPGASDRTGSLLSDVKTVYLHLLLPHPYVDDLPPISNTWGNFGGDEQLADEPASATGSPKRSVPACSRGICDFTSLVDAGRKPTLYFLHSLLPHVPWLYLPSGKHYGGDVRVIPGAETGTWEGSPWLATQARQRYLLQTGYTDAALGLVLRRLRATGIYDRALVIVTADHGETFRPGAPRRVVMRRNLADIAFVPLFVKLPGQKRGRIDDAAAKSVDILPTIADVLGSRVPWHVDGASLLRPGRRPATTVELADAAGSPVRAALGSLLAERREDVAAFAALLRSGSLDRVYGIGPNRQLLGKDVGALDVRAGGSAKVSLTEQEILKVVDLSTSLLPTYLTGTVSPRRGAPVKLAVAVNGKVVATTWSDERQGKTLFSALVPEGSLRQGANGVAVYLVDEKGGRPVLTELGSSDVGYVLRGGAIRSGEGKTVRVAPGALEGSLRVQTPGDTVRLFGWAGDVAARRAAENIVVFVDGRSVFVGHPGNLRRDDVVKRYGIEDAGFAFRLPRALFPPPGDDRTVRVFAISGDRASELPYPATFRWKTR